MIRYSLVCERKHEFEIWFKNSADYDKQVEARAGDLSGLRLGQGREGADGAAARRGTRKGAPRDRGARRPRRARSCRRRAESKAPVAMMSPQEHEFRTKLKELRDHLTKNADNVGSKFPEEARKMHYGEIEHRSIYGEATPDDAKELADEGIEFHPLPVLPDEQN